VGANWERREKFPDVKGIAIKKMVVLGGKIRRGGDQAEEGP